ncbi:MAG: hypothetical protein HOA08_21560 [Rhodospirillaceae bacterium]|jgi:hypothetical protein|nr:hypothetical protein [Rhodospirillaceae bacterium]MBT3490835.1 hypothetical protein [Rhodospirillaceae bacterium]MBT3781089.1 hypothetical protein [Rhodospirillaceae bacterium]MBT3977455.1 hypothetical protein [Rhodospirillaceae bacterium]MBT4170352.1 hypothetical protein [Rhodospirillaceae bacterium]
MTDSNSPQPTPDAPKRWWRGSRRRRIAIGAGAVVLVAFVGGIGGSLAVQFFAGDISSVIRDKGYRPTQPPDNARVVGDVHVVDFFGNVRAFTCKLTTQPDVRTGDGGSVTVSAVSSSSSQAAVDWEVIKGKATGENVTGMEVVLENIRYRKSSDADVNRAMFKSLVTDLECGKLVEQYVKEGSCVAPIVSIMIADGRYVKNIKGKGDVVIDKSNIHSYKEANKYAAKVGLDSNVFVEGENLHYGIQMAERCVASGDAILTRFVPSETWWIFTPFRNLLHEILARVTGA